MKDGGTDAPRSFPQLKPDEKANDYLLVCANTDGAIYVADWYNPIIGHYQASYRHPDRDKEHGRIWRATWKGGPKVTPAKLAGASVADLLEQLDSRERWAWYQSKQLLF
ncbi:hypothetical protein LBMAG56_09130 [Verrucomicrobiota bacterium]|nr:hypothetical protein LBMAG56_09130 [Verrucomicrobiota bacterium]